jgi:hypothetical protein
MAQAHFGGVNMAEDDNRQSVQADPDGLAMYQALFGKPNELPLIGLREFTINHLFAKIWVRSRDP